MEDSISENKRLCSKCGTSNTRKWIGTVCNNCYLYKYKLRRMAFKDKRIYLKENPRTGTCSRCGRKAITHLHHSFYDSSNPLDNTTELCAGCHVNESRRLKQLKTPWVPRDPKTGRFISS